MCTEMYVYHKVKNLVLQMCAINEDFMAKAHKKNVCKLTFYVTC